MTGKLMVDDDTDDECLDSENEHPWFTIADDLLH